MQKDSRLFSGDVSDSPFRQHLCSSTRPDRLVDLPGEWGERGFRARLWRPNDQEILHARKATVEFLSKYFGDADLSLRLAADPAIHQEEYERQILSVALRNPDDPTQRLLAVEDLRNHFNPDERQALLSMLADFCRARSPITQARSEQEVKELVALVGKEPSESAWLSYCDPDTLRSIVRELATQLTSLTRENSLSTGPANSL